MTATRVRYWVLLLTFFTSFIMYMDRVCIGTAAPYIMEDFELDKVTWGWTTSAFNAGYTMFQVPGGWLADRYGARLVLALSMGWWSVFTVAQGLSFNAASLAISRFLFGVGEAAAFPSSSRALARWLPARQRAFGQGAQHAGSRFGAAVTPPVVIFLIARLSWHWVFFIFGLIGLVWAVGWFAYYRNNPQDHPGVNEAELEILRTSGFTEKPKVKPDVPWRTILSSRNLWLISCMYFCYGWVLWLYINWLPTYLVEVRHFARDQVALATSLPLLAATVTNVLGGWTSDKLARRLGDLRRGRLFVSIAGFAIAGVSLIPAVLAEGIVTWLFCLTLALAGLELTVAVSWAICLDIGGEFSGSVSGVMNTMGNLGGTISNVAIGYLSTLFGWNSVFLVASAMCVVAACLARRVNPSTPIVKPS
jgi:sugar phosphate permease